VALAVLIADPASKGRYLGPCLAENGRYRCQEPLYELTDRNLTFCLHCQSYWLVDEHTDLVRRERLEVLVTTSEARNSFEMLGRDPSLVNGLVARNQPDDRHPVTREPMFVLRKLTEADAQLSLLRAAARRSSRKGWEVSPKASPLQKVAFTPLLSDLEEFPRYRLC